MPSDILIFDDDAALAQLLMEVLKNAGFSAAVFLDGKNVPEAVLEHKPRLVLLDIMMPGLDGLTICRLLKSRPETKDIHVVMITGKKFDSEIERASRSGASLFIKKPFSAPLLLDKIIALIGKPTRNNP